MIKDLIYNHGMKTYEHRSSFDADKMLLKYIINTTQRGLSHRESGQAPRNMNLERAEKRVKEEWKTYLQQT